MRRLPGFTHRFRVSGLNLERFLNALEKQDIPLAAARRAGARTLACECYTADLPAIAELAAQKGWRLEDARPARLSAAARFLRGRPGLVAGALLAAALCLTLTRFVWRVEIAGAGPYRADVAQYLAGQGLGAGTPKRMVDADALERALSRRYPQLAWFHVYVYNVTLSVQVTPGVPMPELPDGEARDVVALRDGVVEAVRVFAGTAAVKPGDVVRRGQVLIEGRERGRDEETVPVRARGEVIARCWRSMTVNVPMTEIVSGETGREDTVTRLVTPWASLPAEPEPPPFLASNAYIARLPVVGCFFPVLWETVVRREVWQERRERDPEEARAEAAQAAQKRLAEALRGHEVIDKWTDYCMIEDGILSATATAEWRTEIGGALPP